VFFVDVEEDGYGCSSQLRGYAKFLKSKPRFHNFRISVLDSFVTPVGHFHLLILEWFFVEFWFFVFALVLPGTDV